MVEELGGGLTRDTSALSSCFSRITKVNDALRMWLFLYLSTKHVSSHW